MANTHDDPWVGKKTANGLPADEVISALQKEIRRGNLENAALLAYEMHITSPELEAFLWQRLMVISVEDVGMGALNAPNLIYTLYQMFQTLPPDSRDRPLFIIHAVRYLCTREKDRSSDELLNLLLISSNRGDMEATIPDYAIDKHTQRGKELDRGTEHFYQEGARIFPEFPGRDTSYRDRLFKLLGIQSSSMEQE
jgi:replication-associated recombination protein RarA